MRPGILQGGFGRVCAVVIAGMVSATGVLAQSPDEMARLFDQVAVIDQQGRHQEALANAQHLYTSAAARYGASSPEAATFLNVVAVLHHRQGHALEAERLHKIGLRIRESRLGADHLDVASSLDNLARLYQDLGRIDEAKPLYERALAINERALGRNDPAVTAARSRITGLVESRARRMGLVPAAGGSEPHAVAASATVTAAAPAPAPVASSLAPAAAAMTPAADARRPTAAAKASPKARAQQNADAGWGEAVFGR